MPRHGVSSAPWSSEYGVVSLWTPHRLGVDEPLVARARRYRRQGSTTPSAMSLTSPPLAEAHAGAAADFLQPDLSACGDVGIGGGIIAGGRPSPVHGGMAARWATSSSTRTGLAAVAARAGWETESR